MLNKKGFTVLEVVISFTFVVVILASMFAVVINYQNETEIEKIKSSILVFRDSMLEIVYNDIISNNMEKMDSCGDKCVQIITSQNTYILQSGTDSNGNTYLEYRGTKYTLPDSQNGLSAISTFQYRKDDINKVYEVTIPIKHAELSDQENKELYLQIVVSGKKFSKD